MYEDEFGTCPYDSSHRIALYRMPSHVVKCRKNYRGPALDQCIYNATHLVPMGTMKKHLDTCRDCHRFNDTQYQKLAERCRPPPTADGE